MADRNDFDDIMHNIRAGLTGEAEIDIEYLKGQIEHYKDHELNKEIIRACARLIYDLLPAETVEELSKAIDQESLDVDTTLEEVQHCIYKKDYDKALSIIESLVKKVEDLNAFQDDTVSEYHNFDEPFEEILYDYRMDPEKDLRPAHLARCYRNIGYYFVEKKRWPEATACYMLSLQYDNESQNARLELYYISSATGTKIELPTSAQLSKYSEQYGIPLAPDRDVLGVSYSYGKHFYEQGNKDMARYFLGICYDLAGDEAVGEMLEKLEEGEENDQ